MSIIEEEEEAEACITFPGNGVSGDSASALADDRTQDMCLRFGLREKAVD